MIGKVAGNGAGPASTAAKVGELMARLTLSLLGSFQLTLNGEAVTEWKSNKVRALLAYLATEAGRSFQRDTLGGLLWPDQSDRAARDNLRYALYHLRRTIGDGEAYSPLLAANRRSVQFIASDDCVLDTAAFEALLTVDLAESSAVAYLQSALALYRGPFLEGFFLPDCLEFEGWLLWQRERFSRQLAAALAYLAGAFEQEGDYAMAEYYARRWLQNEPWDESAQRCLLRALACSGRRGEALAYYERSRLEMVEALDMEPASETLALVAAIRAGQLDCRPLKEPERAVRQQDRIALSAGSGRLLRR
jgi:DNA-binding SARP family transcriptional activator